VSNGWIQESKNNFLYHNGRNTNNWINFRLVGSVSNRSAIGAKVRVKATIGGKAFWQMREISGGSGHGCQNDMRANFGLGDATNIDLVRIEWPSGIVQSLTNVASKQFLTVVEHQELPDFGTGPETALTISTNGQPILLITGPLGLRYLVEGSTNLLNWTWLGSRTNLAGQTEFIDARAISLPHGFYRVRIP
jgi:ASPIC and UnbV